MTPLGSARTHLSLTTNMAKALDVDLTEALAGGTLSPESYAGMVTRCRGCSQPEDCAAALADGTVDGAPWFCRNADVLGALAKR